MSVLDPLFRYLENRRAEEREDKRIEEERRAAQEELTKKRNDWVLVQFNTPYTLTRSSRSGKKEETEISVLLYENALRERKHEFKVHNSDITGNKLESVIKDLLVHKEFIDTYWAWLNGHEDEKIPTYLDVKNGNVLVNLKR